MALLNYARLCYSPVLGIVTNSSHVQDGAGFTIWYRRDFDLCFEYLMFSAVVGALFGVASAFYAGIKHTKAQRKRKSPILMLRVIISFCILVTTVVDFVGTFWLSKERPYSVILSLVVLMIAWSLHVFFLWVLSCSVSHYGWGPINLNAVWIVVFVGNILQLRTVIRRRLNPGLYQRSLEQEYFTELSEVAVYMIFSLQCLYGLTLFFKVSRVTGDNVRMYPAHHGSLSAEKGFQWSEETSEGQHLLSSESKTAPTPTTYGSLTASYSSRQTRVVDFGRLEASEDSANPFSLLSFWWVGPLMRRGSLGFLRRPDDLLQLPKSLKTSKVRRRFQQACGIREEGIGELLADADGAEGDSGDSDDSESWHDSLSVNLKGGIPSASQQIKAQQKRQRKTSGTGKEGRLSLFWCLNRSFGLHFYPLGVLKLVADMLGFAGPLLLHALVSFMENETEPISHGYYYALGLFLSTLLASLLTTHFTYQVNKVGLKVRGALITEIYRKSLSVASCTLSKFSTGQIVNFMSTDSDRIVNFCNSFHQFWSLPFQVIVSLVLLYQQVGLAFLGGLAFCVLLIPVNRWLAVKIGKLSTEMMAQKDKRVKVMSEILAGIRVIKLYAWENNFIRKILHFRTAELKSLKGRKYLDALCVYFWATTPVLISIITFGTYVAMGNKLTAAKIFTSLALFNILISPLNAFPWVINGLMEAWVSTKRVNAFLQMEELNLSDYYCQSIANPPSRGRLCSDEEAPAGREGAVNISEFSYHYFSPSGSVSGAAAAHAVSIHRGYFTWTMGSEDGSKDGKDGSRGGEDGSRGGEDGSRGGEDETRPDTGLTPSGGTASVGEDKEASVRRDSEVSKGECERPRTATAEGVKIPWGLANINLAIKPGQFVGVVGKVGSGKSSLLMAITAEMRKTHGQVNVVDLREGFGLFMQESWIQHATLQDNVLFGKPYDANKYRAVISATALEQDIQILPAGDKTEVGENGVTLSGGQKARLALARAVYQDKEIYLLDDPLAAVDAHVASHLYHHCINGLLKHKTRVLATHHTRFLHEADLVVYLEDGRVHSCGPPSDVLPLVEATGAAIPEDGETGRDGGDVHTAGNEDSHDTDNDSAMDSMQLVPDEVVLVKEEESAKGVVSFSVYRSYWAAVGHFLAPLIFCALFLMQASRNISDWWLSYWITSSNSSHNATSITTSNSLHNAISNATPNSSSDDISYYLGIYGALAAANTVFTLFRAFLYAYGGICAAKILHRRLLHSILMAPTSFFDTTPIGRIVNRFSSDIYAIDDSLPFILNILLAQMFGLLGTLAITCYGLPWFTLLLLPLGLFYYNIQNFYRRTSRELKRLSTVTLSPIYAHFSETLTGLCTIRSLRASARFMQENESKLEVNQRANFGSSVVAVWLGIRLQMLGVAMVTGVAFIAVLEHHFNTVNPGLVGLAISYALSVTNLLSGVVTSFTETEKEMVSVERAMQYIKETPTESRGGPISPPPLWPSQGVLEFKNVVLTYREGLPSALKDVCFITKPGEKIGVVGRTGAGKSSLFKAVFRMVELSVGSISIDGINIAAIPLERLRSSLAVIPQDPFLFSGTVRENLDPCAKYSDAEVWFALEQCHLKEAVKRLGGLDSEVEEKGRMFSVGQRQLVCLARALLTQARLICIDEATASVDYQTDTMIQKTIREEFTSSTVITIAHRIDTVLYSDRILVMEQGLVKEFAPPQELLGNHDSFFYSLYRQHKIQSNSA